MIGSDRTRSSAGVRSLARGGVLAFLGSALSGLLGFTFVVLVARSMGVAEAGVLLETVALATVLATAFVFGSDTGLVRSIARYRVQDRSREIRGVVLAALVPVAVVAVVSSALVFFLAPDIGDLIVHGEGGGNAGDYVRTMSLFLPFAAVMIAALSGTRGFGSMLPYVAVSNAAVPSARMIFLGVGLIGGLGGVAAAVAWSLPFVIGSVLGVVALVALVRRATASDAIPLDAADRNRIAREFWRFSFPRGIAALLQSVVVWIGVILVGALNSAREAGIVAAAGRYVSIGGVAMQAIGLATAPLVAGALARDDRREARLIYRAGAWWLVIISWPVYLTLVAFAPLMLRIFGSGFGEGATTLQILCVGMMAQVGTGNCKIVLLMGGRSGWNLISSAASLVLLLALSVALVPDHGAVGGATAWTVTFVLDNLFTTVLVRRLLGVDPFGRGYAISALAALFCFGALGAASRLVFGATGIGLVAFLAVAMPLYLVVIWGNRRRLHLRDVVDGLRRRRADPAEAPETRPVDVGT